MNNSERKQRRKDIAESVRNGMSFKDASRQFGVSYGYVGIACKEFGVSPKNRIRPLVYSGEFHGAIKILALLMDGKKSLRKIGEELGITPARVDQVYQKAKAIDFPGLKSRPKSTDTKD